MNDLLSKLADPLHGDALIAGAALLALAYVALKTPRRSGFRFYLVLTALSALLATAVVTVANGLGWLDVDPMLARAVRAAVAIPGVLLAVAMDSTAAFRRRRKIEKGRLGTMPRLNDLGGTVDDVVRLEERAVRAEGDLAKQTEDLALRSSEVAQMEAKVRETLNLFLSTEEKFRSLFDRAKDGFVEADMKTRRITRANPGMTELTGFPASELTEMPLSEIFGEEFEEGDLVTLSESSQAGKLPPFTITRQDGLPIRIQASFVVILSGERPMLFGLARDVSEKERLSAALGTKTRALSESERSLEATQSELKERTKTLKAMIGKLRELVALKDGFLRSCSIGGSAENPVGSFSEILVNFHQVGSEEQGRYLSVVERETQRLSGLINDVADLARIESGSMEFQLTVVSLEDLAAEVARGMGDQAASRGVSIALRMPEEVPAVEGDRGRLLQVLNQLVGTTIDAARSGGSVEIRARPRKDDLVEIVVGNRGPAVATRELQKVIEKFRQGGVAPESEPEKPETGLEVCREIVAKHGGRIWVRSSPGEGSAFHFTLRAWSSEEPLQVTTAAPSVSEKAGTAGGGELPPLPVRQDLHVSSREGLPPLRRGE